MKSFEKIYESSRNKSNGKQQYKILKESYSEFCIKDELVNDLEAAMNKVISEYKTMDLNRDQFIECIEEVCDVVKNNIERGYY